MIGHVVDARLEAVLADYDARQAREDLVTASLSAEEMASRRDEFLVGVGRATGLLLNLLVREAGARSVLELGTSAGYSTLWLADAARATGGRVRSVDAVRERHAAAGAALERAGLIDVVDFHCGDALAFLAATSATFDFVLLDLWKDAYIPAIDAVIPRLHDGAIVVADNMLEPPGMRFAAARYRAHLRLIERLQTVLLPVGSGLAVSRYGGSMI